MKFLYKMYKYEMDPTRTVEATERTRDGRGTDGVKPIYPPTTSLCGGGGGGGGGDIMMTH